jgi:hypothetical protein
MCRVRKHECSSDALNRLDYSQRNGATNLDATLDAIGHATKRRAVTSAARQFWYEPGRERIRQLAQKSASTTGNRLFVGGLFEKMTRTASGTPTTEHVYYVRGGGGQAIAVVNRESGA